MNRQDVISKITDIARLIIEKENRSYVEEVTDETVFKNKALNSLEYIALIVELETEYGIEFDDELLNQNIIDSFDILAEHIVSKVHSKGDII